MTRKVYNTRGHETGTIITTKTAFGSTSDMIIDLNKYTLDGKSVLIKDDEAVCKDDKGFYITLKSRIDNKTADPNRYANAKNRLDLKEKEESSS
jgi:hypothetical protein